MLQYTVDGIKKLGEYDQKYGQRFWATTPDGDLPLMFNVMDADFANNIENGAFQIVAEEKSERESGKGTPYLMLKKVKLVEGAQQALTKKKVAEVFGGEKPAQNAQLDRIEQKLEEILALLLPENP